ncbi:MAG TPA: 2Fe-2S iron-sulfur cluster-binding protein, partial [Planctomycetota bacterium]|nr:2Fe-2S iron-sulfur cluster-binding protein [Planctomycetota bacterium]
MADLPERRRSAFTRRSFLKGAGGIAAGGIAGQAAQGTAEAFEQGQGPERLSGTVELELSINGAKQKVKVEPRTTLLNALRNHCEPPLTGAKLVCDHGSCGACTVLL